MSEYRPVTVGIQKVMTIQHIKARFGHIVYKLSVVFTEIKCQFTKTIKTFLIPRHKQRHK